MFGLIIDCWEDGTAVMAETEHNECEDDNAIAEAGSDPEECRRHGTLLANAGRGRRCPGCPPGEEGLLQL